MLGKEIERALKTNYPKRITLVVCKDEKGKVNITPIAWFMNASCGDPQTWLISLWKDHYSTKVISKTKEFTLCFPTLAQGKDVMYCGTHSGSKVDKLANCSFKPLPAKKIKAPLIKGCTACFECKVIWKKLVYNQMAFCGKVVSASVCGKGKPLFYDAKHKLGTIKWLEAHSSSRYKTSII